MSRVEEQQQQQQQQQQQLAGPGGLNAIALPLKRRSSRNCGAKPVSVAERRARRRRPRRPGSAGCGGAGGQEQQPPNQQEAELAAATAAATTSGKLHHVRGLMFDPPTDSVNDDLRENMAELLNMHSPYELRTLCCALGLPKGGKRDERLARIWRDRLGDVGQFRDCMQLMWEGTLVDYLKTRGFRMEQAAEDPKKTVLRYWVNMRAPAVPAFSEGLVPATVQAARKQITSRPASLHMLRDVEELERRLKDAELRVRRTKGHDMVPICDFLALTRNLRQLEGEGRRALMADMENEVSLAAHLRASRENARSRLAAIERERQAAARARAAREAPELAMGSFFLGVAAGVSAQGAVERHVIEHAQHDLKEALARLQSQVARSQTMQAKSVRSARRAVEAVEETIAQRVEMAARLDEADALYEELAGRHVRYAAADEAAIDVLEQGVLAGAAPAVVQMEERLRRATAVLLPMLRAEQEAKAKSNPVADAAAQLLVGLDVLQPGPLREKREQVAMWRQELEQLRTAAIREAKDPANKKKAKKAKKPPKKKRGGKGGKKGKGKGKKAGGAKKKKKK
jgi:hypothetical protein